MKIKEIKLVTKNDAETTDSNIYEKGISEGTCVVKKENNTVIIYTETNKGG